MCLPPSKGVFINMFTISSASFSVTNLAGIQIIFALLCILAKDAISVSQQIAARIPWCLFAVIATPFAEPQTNIPKL